MTAYSVAAIPTMYNGRQYRSRLEARWAAFFNRLNWTFEYEPFDLGLWSPDFLLPPQHRTWACSLLVEVKPVNSFDAAVADKMERATKTSDTLTRLLLLGVQPRDCDGDWDQPLQIGWCGFRSEIGGPVVWEPASIHWMPVWDSPHFKAAIPIKDHKFYPRDALTGSGALTAEDVQRFAYRSHTMELWASATNAVQWRGEQAQP